MDSPGVMDKGSQFYTSESDHLVPVKKFHQGQPVALGITQMFIGITGIIFGIMVHYTEAWMSDFLMIKIPYWGGILYVISGSLSVAAARNPKIPLVKGMLAMNVISAIVAGLGIVLLSFPINNLLFSFSNKYCNNYDYDTKEKCVEIQSISMGILSFLTMIHILEFCITISVASFGCKMLCRDPFVETVVVVYQNVTPSSTNQHPPLDCKQPAIHP
ncbi:membrane-spanning 4-domains subfamily A member 4A-like [Erythrolamprus reginae]|uniref:membrane-spanning 4-domains subfamily A member 4A-like n=1 Tax=Erythrolamprus reginae TaxID=121349 RepID=UPI00396C69A3